MNKRRQHRPVAISIGSPRSGTTLLGALLMKHVDIMVGFETALVPEVVLRNRNWGFALLLSRGRAAISEIFGLSANRKTLSRFQRKWRDPYADSGFLERVRTVCLRFFRRYVFFEKKSGGNIKAFIKDEPKFLRLLVEHPEIVLIHIYRHPAEAARSYADSHPNEVKSVEEAAKQVCRLSEAAFQLGEIFPSRYFELRYEELQNAPTHLLGQVFEFLDVPVDDNTMEKCVGLIDRNTKSTMGDGRLQQDILDIVRSYPRVFDRFQRHYLV